VPAVNLHSCCLCPVVCDCLGGIKKCSYNTGRDAEMSKYISCWDMDVVLSVVVGDMQQSSFVVGMGREEAAPSGCNSTFS